MTEKGATMPSANYTPLPPSSSLTPAPAFDSLVFGHGVALKLNALDCLDLAMAERFERRVRYSDSPHMLPFTLRERASLREADLLTLRYVRGGSEDAIAFAYAVSCVEPSLKAEIREVFGPDPITRESAHAAINRLRAELYALAPVLAEGRF